MADTGRIFYKLIVNFIKKFINKKVTEKRAQKSRAKAIAEQKLLETEERQIKQAQKLSKLNYVLFNYLEYTLSIRKFAIASLCLDYLLLIIVIPVSISTENINLIMSGFEIALLLLTITYLFYGQVVRHSMAQISAKRMIIITFIILIIFAITMQTISAKQVDAMTLIKNGLILLFTIFPLIRLIKQSKTTQIRAETNVISAYMRFSGLILLVRLLHLAYFICLSFKSAISATNLLFPFTYTMACIMLLLSIHTLDYRRQILR